MKDPEWKKILEEDYKTRGQRKPGFYSDSHIELADDNVKDVSAPRTLRILAPGNYHKVIRPFESNGGLTAGARHGGFRLVPT